MKAKRKSLKFAREEHVLFSRFSCLLFCRKSGFSGFGKNVPVVFQMSADGSSSFAGTPGKARSTSWGGVHVKWDSPLPFQSGGRVLLDVKGERQEFFFLADRPFPEDREACLLHLLKRSFPRTGRDVYHLLLACQSYVCVPPALENHEGFSAGIFRGDWLVQEKKDKQFWNLILRQVKKEGGIAKKELLKTLGIPEDLLSEYKKEGQKQHLFTQRQGHFVSLEAGAEERLSPFGRSVYRDLQAAGLKGIPRGAARKNRSETLLEALVRMNLAVEFENQWFIALFCLAEIEEKLDALGHEPDLGEIRALTGLDRGRSMALLMYRRSRV